MKPDINKNESEEKDMADKAIEAVENFVNTKNHIDEHNKLDVMGYKTKASICYIPFTMFYFIIKGEYKKNSYMLFHVNQGAIVTIIWIIVLFVTRFLSDQFRINGLFITRIPTIISFINYILYCLALGISAFGFVNTVNGHSKEIPIIGKFTIFK